MEVYKVKKRKPGGPSMGPRPADFDEDKVRASPTFKKWSSLSRGKILRYASRDFVKGEPDDEERLMRRIMIARRNNVKDHNALKEARSVKQKATNNEPLKSNDDAVTESSSKREDAKSSQVNNQDIDDSEGMPNDSDLKDITRSMYFLDEDARIEMDVEAVKNTKSYKAWEKLPVGAKFVYTHTYVKGKPNDDWLLRKNIWRRMRYRRKNMVMLDELQLSRTTMSKKRKISTQK